MGMMGIFMGKKKRGRSPSLCFDIFIVFLHSVRALLLHLFGYVTVDIQGKGCGGVSKVLLHGLYIVSLLQSRDRVCVA
jgi:hypothetical protein